MVSLKGFLELSMTANESSKRILLFMFLAGIAWTLYGCNKAIASPSPLNFPNQRTQMPSIILPTSTTVNSLPTVATTKPPISWQVVANWPGINNIRAILSTSDGYIWTGGPDALTKWNPETGETVAFVFDPNLPEYGSKVVDLVETSDKSIWVATFGYGLSRFRDEKWEVYTKENAITNNDSPARSSG